VCTTQSVGSSRHVWASVSIQLSGLDGWVIEEVEEASITVYSV
jgi:hypothetical protein